MSETNVNSFSELNSDAHPLNTQNSVMVDAMNATLTTKGDNQLILQNMTGNELKALVTPGYTPIACEVHRNIAYIISGKYDSEGNFLNGEIGTFPSPRWSELFAAGSDPENFIPLENVYKPLHNFHSTYNELEPELSDDATYTEPFRTPQLNFPDRLIELEIQPSYDGSVNLIFTDDQNPLRLVNSRFKLSEDGKSASIAERRQAKDTNTYSNARFIATRLFKSTKKIPELTFEGLFAGSGELNGGGYRFYFRYMDTDGSLTDVIEESRTVTVAYDYHGAGEEENTGRSARFTLGNLDKQFSGVKVYFSYSSGDLSDTSVVYEITNIYDIPSDPNIDQMTIIIYGNEPVYEIDRSSLNVNYYSLDHARTITQYDDRLLIGNTTNEFLDYDVFKELAQKIKIKESPRNMEFRKLGSGFADPMNVYHNLGYWAGETYELGVVWILKDGQGLTPVFPIRGYDNFEGQNIYGYQQYTEDVIDTPDGYLPNSTENRLGAYRTRGCRDLLIGDPINIETPIGEEPSYTENRGLVADMSSIVDSEFLEDRVDGYFFVRKPRKKDCLWSGMLTNTAQMPIKQVLFSSASEMGATDTTSSYFQAIERIGALLRLRVTPNAAPIQNGGHIGPAFTNKKYHLPGFKIVPAPGRSFEMTITDSRTDTLSGGEVSPAIPIGTPLSMQGRVWPFPMEVGDEEQHWSFYTSDMLCAPEEIAAFFNGSKYGIETNDNGAIRGYQRMQPVYDTTAENASSDGVLYKFGGFGYSVMGPVTDNAEPIPTFSFGPAELGFARHAVFATELTGIIDPNDENIMTGTANGHIGENGASNILGESFNWLPFWTYSGDIDEQSAIFGNANTVFSGVPFIYDIAAGTITMTINFPNLRLANYADTNVEYDVDLNIEIGVSDFQPGIDGSMSWEYINVFWSSQSRADMGFPANLALQSYAHMPGLHVSSIIGSPGSADDPASHYINTFGIGQWLGSHDYYGQEGSTSVSSGFPRKFFTYNITDLAIEGISLYEQITPLQNVVYDPIEYCPKFAITHETADRTAEFEYINRGNDAFADGEFSALLDRNVYGIYNRDYDLPDNLAWDFVHFAEDHIEYGDYVGITLSNSSSSLSEELDNEDVMVFSARARTASIWGEYDLGFNDLGNWAKRNHIDGYPFGVHAKIFKSRNGHIDEANWKIKYANTTPEESYFAITERLPWLGSDTPDIKFLFDGDCYLNYTYKRAWYKQGIPGVDTATDPKAWESYNQSGGIYPKGMVFPVINEGNYNSALRGFQDGGPVEKLLYGQKRKFYPLDDIETIRSSRQNETTEYNFGYNHKGEREYYKTDDRAPFLNVNYETRVYISEPAIAGSFVNGYRNFYGLAYRDYQKNLGQIIKLISHNNAVFMVQENGISRIPVNEKTQISDSQGGVFVEAATVLGEKPYVLSSEYGSDQQFSIRKTDNFIYGVDYDKNKVWRIVPGTGEFSPEIISDFAVTTILNAYKDRLRNSPFEEVILTNYDRERNNVIFSYLSKEPGMGLNSDYYVRINPDGEVVIETTDGEATPISLPDDVGGFTTIEAVNDVYYEPVTISTNGVGVLYPEEAAQPVLTPLGETPQENYDGALVDVPQFNAGDQEAWTLVQTGVGVYTLPDGTVFRRWRLNEPASLYYNETIQKWVSRLSWSPLFTFNLGNRLYSFNALKDRHNIWRHFSQNVPYCHFYGSQDTFFFEFVLVDNPAVQKILENLMIVSNESYPTQIRYKVDSNFDFETGAESNASFEEDLKPCVYHINLGLVDIVDIDGLQHFHSSSINLAEAKRLQGGNFVFDDTLYLIGEPFVNNNIIVLPLYYEDGSPVTQLPIEFEINSINFSIFKSNIQYIEDHMYLEVGKSKDESLVRDKYIKLKLTYRGNDFTVIQSIISLFDYSYS